MLNHEIHESVELLSNSDMSGKSSTKYVNPDA